MNKLKEIAPKGINPRYWLFNKVTLDDRPYEYIIWMNGQRDEYREKTKVEYIDEDHFDTWLYEKHRDVLEIV